MVLPVQDYGKTSYEIFQPSMAPYMSPKCV